MAMIEKFTGEAFADTVERRLSHPPFPERCSQLAGELRAETPDAAVCAISTALRLANLSWQDVFTEVRRAAGGIPLVQTGDELLNRFFATNWDKARPLYGDAAPAASSDLPRIPRKQLPAAAGVSPTLISRGVRKDRGPYATFRLTGWHEGRHVQFLGTFVTFGEEAISKLAKPFAPHFVAVRFKDDGILTRLVEIEPIG